MPLEKRPRKAGVGQEVARVFGPAVPLEIGGRRRRGEPLDARSDRNCDHVLLQPLVVADAGVATRSQHVDEAVLGDDLHLDVGIGGEEAGQDGGQHQAGGADRHIETERARQPVAKAVHHVERRFHLAERGGQPVDQPGACLGRRDAAGGAVEQPDAQPRFEATHRLA